MDKKNGGTPMNIIDMHGGNVTKPIGFYQSSSCFSKFPSNGFSGLAIFDSAIKHHKQNDEEKMFVWNDALFDVNSSFEPTKIPIINKQKENKCHIHDWFMA